MKTTLSPYLNFNGNCAEAMTYYQSVLGGELTMQTFGEVGFADSPEIAEKIVHAQLENGEVTLMASDGTPDRTISFGDNVHLSIVGSDVDRLSAYFKKLAEGGRVDMPLEKQFWGDVFGMLTDKFGVHWMVNVAASEQG